MPNPQVDLELVRGCDFFGLFDFIKGYWQIALDEACQEVLSYMTHRKIYTPRRVPQGSSDAALFFQATIEKCLQELMYKHLLVWIDDLLLYASGVENYLAKLERLFELLDFYGFKLSVAKSSLYEPRVKWCGKIITGQGVSHDPDRIKALTTLSYPTNAGELQQFLCAANWMRESVVDFARAAKPLQEKLDHVLATASRRTKRVVSGIGIELMDTERAAFDELKNKLTNSASLAFPEPDAVMCLITDASDVGYGIIVTQVRSWQAGNPVIEQQYELLVCHVKGGKVVPRPWGETFRCYERNGAFHWDFLTVGESFGSDKYLLVLKDEATHYCGLVPCASPTSMVAAEAILDWHSRCGIPPIWFSDHGSHFKNEVVAVIGKRLKSEQRFSVAHSPWINGSIERVNRDVIQVLKVLCLEYKKDIRDWTSFVPLLRASINHTPLPSLGNKAPVELFCALPLPSPLDFCVDAEQKRIVELTKQPELIAEKLQQLRESVQHMHRAVAAERERQTRRKKSMQSGARKANFSVGDFVLRSRVDQKYQDKLLVTWVGPYQIKRADKHLFVVQHLVTGVETDVHASRLKYYADKDYEVTEEVREHIASQGIVLAVAELKEHRWNASIKSYEILVSWQGLEPIEDSWEPLRSLWKDIPVLVRRYAESAADTGLSRYIERTTRFAR
ncbi:hypothetical protein PR003_g9399 [Phytophthora rubi]|uniref:Integrase catalytic domain-containing protein n=1 Tax=Phytophthora rubi TaxID=129364 RepID=A0A6A4FSE9_9STRA|nr:hypothetical protein PR003_g9399 [Phytophthora rubi]